MDKESAVARIASVLQPYVGKTMAEASLKAHWDKLGIGERLNATQLDALVGRLASGLAVFVGREKAQSVVAEIRTAMGDLS